MRTMTKYTIDTHFPTDPEHPIFPCDVANDYAVIVENKDKNEVETSLIIPIEDNVIVEFYPCLFAQLCLPLMPHDFRDLALCVSVKNGLTPCDWFDTGQHTSRPKHSLGMGCSQFATQNAGEPHPRVLGIKILEWLVGNQGDKAHVSDLVTSWVMYSPFEYARLRKGAKAYTTVVFGKSLLALEQFVSLRYNFRVHATNIVLDSNLEDKWKILLKIIKMVDAAVSYADEKLGDFLIEEVSLRQSLRENVLWLRNELSFMQAFLKDAQKKQEQDNLVQQWIFEITSVANEAVYILEAYSLDAAKDGDYAVGFVDRLKACSCIHQKEAKFHNIGKEIQSLKERVMDISRKRDTYGITYMNINAREGPSNRPNDPSSSLIRTLRRAVSYAEKDQLFVGFQEYSILRSIIKSIQGYHEKMLKLLKEMTETDLETHLRNLLKERKYLVVVDDVWHREAWESLKRALPDNNNGSRVILTTRKEDVAERVDDKGFSHKLRFLNKEESWDLLCKKLHPENKMSSADLFSPSMKRLATEMVEKCRGLPLAIVVLGGLLSYRKGVDEWQKVKTHLWQHMKNDSVEISHILSLSYNDLSFELKQCFLYIGSFQEDHVIDAEKLMRLWLAEGFIPRI
uniref:R2 n=1 Tax=Solanum tuberosum TaxID=4113 RepID=M1APS8_SOLTU